MTNESLKRIQTESRPQAGSDPFGLGGFDFNVRIPEKSELFTAKETQTYIDKCDYPNSADDLLLALEMRQLFGPERIRRMWILDAMCGPGRLGRELLALGASHVVFHDGDGAMTSHARNRAREVLQPGERGMGSMDSITSFVDRIPVGENTFDLVVCHNATHQLSDIDRLDIVMREFLRITESGGHIVIADFQRPTTPEFLPEFRKALEDRLWCTDPEIVPLLIPSFFAAFSKQEFSDVIKSIPGIRKWSVIDAKLPTLTPQMQEVVDRDHIKGHVMDFSPISLRVIVQKE